MFGLPSKLYMYTLKHQLKLEGRTTTGIQTGFKLYHTRTRNLKPGTTRAMLVFNGVAACCHETQPPAPCV
jgi:hypothetical protein